MSDDRHIRQQLLAARPWDAAEPESLWSITGRYPNGGSFTSCLAWVLPEYVTGTDKPLFVMLPPLSSEVDPAWITHALPLLIVLRNEPHRTYFVEDQDLIEVVP